MDAAAACDEPAARAVVEQLGERMNSVSLLAPDSIVDRTLRQAYEPLVTQELLAAWLADPRTAPGREVSSPWPERIEVRSVDESAGGCRVEGDVVYATSTDTAGASARRARVVITVREAAGWRISAYGVDASDDVDPADPASDDEAAAVDTIERYYAAINARDYQRAFASWSGEGTASGQTFDEFAAGFAETARVRVEIGAPGRIEGAAGSRYIELPVVIEAETAGGGQQRFTGTYTLRRSVVDGATAEQRTWRIYSADIIAG